MRRWSSYCSKSANIKANNSSGWTASPLASLSVRKAAIRVFPEKEADIEAKDFSGMTTIQSATSTGRETGVNFLL
jgi:ankyrin repeat protein